ncbi:hypothetical protein ACS0TY_022739 [Phlomoides rotata]
MAFVILRRFSILRSTTNPLLSCKFSTSRASKFIGHDIDRVHSVADQLHLSPLFSETGKNAMKNCKIELVDDATWNVSSSLADDWRGNNGGTTLKLRPHFSDQDCDDDDGRIISSVDSNKNDPDFDEIEDMRIRGKLFYKLDKGSKEYEECKFDFHRRKGSREKSKKEDTMAAKTDPVREIKKNKERKLSPFLECNDNEDSCIEKKQRSLTFNQLTAPYHEPFCLDIYISNSSVRASIIHRATSNVVASSHSISKDMKFDLGSTKNRIACAAVGKVLAQTALADDIHNVVYTPRRGERLEGKLEIVLKSIIDGGVDVKVKLKQKKTRRFLPPRTRGQD